MIWDTAKRAIRWIVATAKIEIDSIRVAVWIAVGGGSLAVANLLFAGLLSASDFGKLTFLLALLSLGAEIGPLGLNILAVRGELAYNLKSLLLGSVSSIIAASVLCLWVGSFYELGTGMLGVVALGAVGGGIGRICAAFEQREVRLDRGQIIEQLPFVVFVFVAGMLLVFDLNSLITASIAVSGGYLASGVLGALLFMSGYPSDGDSQAGGMSIRGLWIQALTLFAIIASSMLLGKIERFIIPHTLSLAELGTFGVAWTVIGSPYKLLAGGIGYALLPKLRSTEEIEQSLNLVWQEVKLAVTIGGSAAIVLVGAGPYLITFLYGTKYPVSRLLMVSIVVLGFSRLFYGVVDAVVLAKGDKGQLRRFGVAIWGAIGVTVLLAIWLSRWGLVGVVLAVSFGWILRGVCALLLSPVRSLVIASIDSEYHV